MTAVIVLFSSIVGLLITIYYIVRGWPIRRRDRISINDLMATVNDTYISSLRNRQSAEMRTTKVRVDTCCIDKCNESAISSVLIDVLRLRYCTKHAKVVKEAYGTYKNNLNQTKEVPNKTSSRPPKVRMFNRLQ